jgi:putative spermidine/putrescine transport system permease protein
MTRIRRPSSRSLLAWLQAAPLAAVFVIFFVVPLVLIAMVSTWQATDYELIPAFTGQNYLDVFNGCGHSLVTAGEDVCVTLKTYGSTLKFSLLTWLITAALGFSIAYFLAFHVKSQLMQTVLFIVCTVPFWTSNVIRMISWVPLLGRNGLINSTLVAMGVIEQPIEWLLFSEFSVVLAFVHLYTMFMIVPIFNSMMRIDRALLEAARDNGAKPWQTVLHVVLPLSKTGLIIGSIFVLALVMGDFVTVGVMGGQQIASVGKVIQVQTSYLQFPLAAANAMILLAVVLMMIVALMRLVNLRKEL